MAVESYCIIVICNLDSQKILLCQDLQCTHPDVM